MKKIFSFLLVPLLALTVSAQEPVSLPAPQTEGGIPLMKAFSLRQTHREFSGRSLTNQQLSNLLWAADGINRPESGKRTAPSAMNFQEIDLYVVMEKGVYVYDAEKHQLRGVASGDSRALTGIQAFAADAPLTLVLVADLAKMTKADTATRDLYAMADAAYISQNIYLFCASEGLNTGARAYIDKEKLAPALKLKADQKIMLAQSVGYPKN